MNLDALRQSLPPRLLRIAEEIHTANGRAFLVGGWVRDAWLGRESRDYDIEVYGLQQDELLRILRRFGRPNLVGKSYGVILLDIQGYPCDFSFPRLESKTGTGHRAFAVEARPDLDFHTAALRRDFTINAMGMELPEMTLVDPHGGLRDLEDHRLRHVSAAFAEDPLRVLRAVQFAARFDLQLEPETVELCRSLDLRELSRERLYEEFRKWLLQALHPSRGLEVFQQLELQRFFPWLQTPQGGIDLWGACLDRAVQTHEGSPVEQMALMLALLACGADSKESVLAFLESLTQETALLKQVPALWSEGPQLLSALEDGRSLQAPWLRRLALRVALPQACAWVRAWVPPEQQNLLQSLDQTVAFAHDLDVWEQAPIPLLTGKILLDMGMRPGRLFGEWIAESFELQLDGQIINAEQARTWAERKSLEILHFNR
ncbi:MAG TPA: CCA tRNA nucleotidyltransferase [Fibrobacteraceae bacterium]|nr:CCA tRNA nucleotidyltransferase [Fibrobacteraceae bacterium]